MPSPPHPPGLAVTWHGHSTTLIEIDGTRVLTDPVLRSRVAHLVRHAQAPEAGAGDVDLVLLSHAHRDHLDYPSLRRVPRSATVVVPRGLGQKVARLAFPNVVEVVEGDALELAGVHVRATHADHGTGRGGLPGGATPVGYLVTGSTTTYFAGDTDVFAAMSEIGPVDLALLPVSGWGPTTPEGHLDAARAVEALQLLRPRHAIPIHWGTFRPFYRRQPYESDTLAPGRFAALAHEVVPEVDVRVLRVGERWAMTSSDADDAPAAPAGKGRGR